MSLKQFSKKYYIILQILFLLFLFSPNNSFSQEKFLLTQEDLPDYKLDRQGTIYWYDTNQQIREGIDQEWTDNNGDNYLYFNYYECKNEFEAINWVAYRAGSFAGPYYFGFPTGEIKGNSSWTSLGRNAAFIQKWSLVVQIFTNLFDSPVISEDIVSNISDKLLLKISDSISTEFLVKDTELKKYQIPFVNYTQITEAAVDTLVSNSFSEYKVEDSKWIFNTDSLVMGIRKQWSAENSIFSIDVAGFSNNADAQIAVEQNANIKGSPFFLLNDEESLEKAIEDWNYLWSVYDTMKYISVIGRTGSYSIHFYYFAEDGIDIELFKRVILATAQMGTGINNNKTDLIKVYPNPATNFITISSPAGIPGKYLLVIRDIHGRQVILKTLELSGFYLLDISKVPQGIYFLTLKNESRRVVKKIFVQ